MKPEAWPVAFLQHLLLALLAVTSAEHELTEKKNYWTFGKYI